jgi:HSP20 family protein
MALVKWTPWADLDAMERRMRRFFDDVGFVPAPTPAADIYETDKEFVVELEVPGYEGKDLEVALADHTLVVRGELVQAKEEKEKTFHLHERLETAFERRFTIPPEVDLGHFDANFEKGVLKVKAPKLEATAPKKIEIGAKA